MRELFKTFSNGQWSLTKAAQPGVLSHQDCPLCGTAGAVPRQLPYYPPVDLGHAGNTTPEEKKIMLDALHAHRKSKEKDIKIINKAEKDIAGDEIDSSMLMSELESLKHHIEEIKEHLTESEIAPDWVKAKVTRAASSMSDIAHYIMGLKEK